MELQHNQTKRNSEGRYNLKYGCQPLFSIVLLALPIQYLLFHFFQKHAYHALKLAENLNFTDLKSR
jgi:hypothetical protein